MFVKTQIPFHWLVDCYNILYNYRFYSGKWEMTFGWRKQWLTGLSLCLHISGQQTSLLTISVSLRLSRESRASVCLSNSFHLLYMTGANQEPTQGELWVAGVSQAVWYCCRLWLLYHLTVVIISIMFHLVIHPEGSPFWARTGRDCFHVNQSLSRERETDVFNSCTLCGWNHLYSVNLLV